MTILAKIYGDPICFLICSWFCQSDPTRSRFAVIRSDPVLVLSIRSDPIHSWYCKRPNGSFCVCVFIFVCMFFSVCLSSCFFAFVKQGKNQCNLGTRMIKLENAGLPALRKISFFLPCRWNVTVTPVGDHFEGDNDGFKQEIQSVYSTDRQTDRQTDRHVFI